MLKSFGASQKIPWVTLARHYIYRETNNRKILRVGCEVKHVQGDTVPKEYAENSHWEPKTDTFTQTFLKRLFCQQWTDTVTDTFGSQL